MISNALTMCIIGLDDFPAHVYVTNHLDIIASAFEQKCAVCLCLCFCFLVGANSVYGYGSRFERAARTYGRTRSVVLHARPPDVDWEIEDVYIITIE
jgi:hypothetical protein